MMMTGVAETHDQPVVFIVDDLRRRGLSPFDSSLLPLFRFLGLAGQDLHLGSLIVFDRYYRTRLVRFPNRHSNRLGHVVLRHRHRFTLLRLQDKPRIIIFIVVLIIRLLLYVLFEALKRARVRQQQFLFALLCVLETTKWLLWTLNSALRGLNRLLLLLNDRGHGGL